MTYTPSGWAPLQPILHDILLTHKDGLSEFEILNILKSPPYELFAARALADPLSLFQTHFILFNALYKLQDTWLNDKIGILQIHCTCIRYHAWSREQVDLATQDKLRSYYLNWNNLGDTGLNQVEALLDSFWSAFSGIPSQAQDSTLTQQKALDILDLTPPYSAQQLKQQYRKMLHIHHPDKGGNNDQTVQLHNAYAKLKMSCL